MVKGGFNMPNPFRAGWQLGSRVIKPGIQYTCGVIWGVFCPAPDDVQVVPVKGDLELPDDAKTVLSDALAQKDKNLFVSMLYEYKERFDLDPVKVAQAVTICLEALKRGAPETTRNACLNLLGASILN